MNLQQLHYFFIRKMFGTRRLHFLLGKIVVAQTLLSLLSCVVLYFLMVPANEIQYEDNLYIPVEIGGKPIEPVKGDEELLSEEEMNSFLEECTRKMFDISRRSLQAGIMRYAKSCTTVESLKGWQDSLESSGFLELIKDGSILHFTANSIKLERKGLNTEGRFQWSYNVSGELTRYFNQTYRTALEINVIVQRENVIEHEDGIAIKRVVF
ncbi:DotI/IcmL/TraM family protein [Idiomarina abyssalis]|uniref:DotI/IcmL/TraM family protein n=1 Tax=Idiomarina abyssalis TaxID=86102 RepID=A0A8I1KFA0_9GAMM|nr:DotI/IcmL/TraM family protein [Idiomarina abyssalis]MBJ7265570.1 DotI/IcmL/TraM family protein [Idiomarina abyssalis]MBJ7316756.1 DotI/IcmL/TraM family protein [Idiomarina abyssalis]